MLRAVSALDGASRWSYGAPVQFRSARMMTRFGATACALLGFACSGARFSSEPGAPTLVVPAHVAEGSNQAPSEPAPAASGAAAKSASAPTPVGSADAAPAAALEPSSAPDPAALRMAEQVEYELELRDGKIEVVSVKPVKLGAPIVTPRRVGRYAIELSIGHELIERLRFDFPGTAADEAPAPAGSRQKLYAPLGLSRHAVAKVKLSVPQSPRVRRALLVDRGANTATELDWPLPPPPPIAPSAPSAAAPAIAPSAAPAPASSAAPR